ncbi:MAG: hypothetical protein IJT94_09040 [Oscillibacter sp.]|nr:hypothetical protein [Oscillibacter sp.]
MQKLVNALLRDGIPGTVNVRTYLSIRAKPDADSREMDRYRSGQSVRITEVREGKGASAWGRTRSGEWISMDYVELEGEEHGGQET